MYEIQVREVGTTIRATGCASVHDLYRGVCNELAARGTEARMDEFIRLMGLPSEAYEVDTLALNLEGVIQDGIFPQDLDGWIKAIADEYEANLDAFLSHIRARGI